ncbi:MAG: PH domain-containing protein [Candidatus Buchananbacteria bacterium]
MISKNNLSDKRPEEKIVFHLRRHWFIFFKLFFGYILLSILPLVGFYYFYFVYQINILNYAGGAVIGPFFLVLILMYYMAMLLFSFSLWTDMYLDVWTLTTERIISREQKGLFNRVVSELELLRVQDVTVEQKGMLATFLGYGDVYIQTAGEKERFIFQQIPHPYKVAKMIQNLDEQIKAKNPTV